MKHPRPNLSSVNQNYSTQEYYHISPSKKVVVNELSILSGISNCSPVLENLFYSKYPCMLLLLDTAVPMLLANRSVRHHTFLPSTYIELKGIHQSDMLYQGFMVEIESFNLKVSGGNDANISSPTCGIA